MKKNLSIKTWNKLFRFQVIAFAVFSVLSFIYYYDKSAHLYFNRSVQEYNFQGIFSLLITFLWIFFIFICLAYPFLLGYQYFFLKIEHQTRREKLKKFAVLLGLYFTALFFVVALFSILLGSGIQR